MSRMKNFLANYQTARDKGHPAKWAYLIAKTIGQWESLNGYFADGEGHRPVCDEHDALVRVRFEPECESYFGVYGEPDGYIDINGRKVSPEQERENICRMINRNGLWHAVAEYRDDTDSDWEHCDSIGMLLYENVTDVFENDYLRQLMQSAIDMVNRHDYAI